MFGMQEYCPMDDGSDPAGDLLFCFLYLDNILIYSSDLPTEVMCTHH